MASENVGLFHFRMCEINQNGKLDPEKIGRPLNKKNKKERKKKNFGPSKCFAYCDFCRRQHQVRVPVGGLIHAFG